MRFVLCILIMALYGLSALAESDYFPLHVGDEWTSSTTFVASDGTIVEGIFHRKVEDSIDRQGSRYFRLRSWSEGMPKNWDYTKLMRKNEKAVYSIDERIPDAVEQVEFALPLKVGSSWQWSEGSKTMTDTVKGLEAVEISGRIYKDCFHIQRLSEDGSITEDYWQAPNVGDLRSINVFADGSKITLTLKEFKSGK